VAGWGRVGGGGGVPAVASSGVGWCGGGGGPNVLPSTSIKVFISQRLVRSDEVATPFSLRAKELVTAVLL